MNRERLIGKIWTKKDCLIEYEPREIKEDLDKSSWDCCNGSVQSSRVTPILWISLFISSSSVLLSWFSVTFSSSFPLSPFLLSLLSLYFLLFSFGSQIHFLCLLCDLSPLPFLIFFFLLFLCSLSVHRYFFSISSTINLPFFPSSSSFVSQAHFLCLLCFPTPLPFLLLPPPLFFFRFTNTPSSISSSSSFSTSIHFRFTDTLSFLRSISLSSSFSSSSSSLSFTSFSYWKRNWLPGILLCCESWELQQSSTYLNNLAFSDIILYPTDHHK